MASKADHERKAASNLALVPPLERLDSHPDWVVTLKFYTAVHWMRAYLAANGKGLHPTAKFHYNQFGTEILNHARLGQGITPMVEDAVDAFQELRDLSEAARYHCLPRGYFDRQMYEVDQALERVRKFVAAGNVST